MGKLKLCNIWSWINNLVNISCVLFNLLISLFKKLVKVNNIFIVNKNLVGKFFL